MVHEVLSSSRSGNASCTVTFPVAVPTERLGAHTPLKRFIHEGGERVSNVPDGAQHSDDGRWWWDGENWQPVTHGDGAAARGDGGERAAARAALGLPASFEELSDEQRKQFLGEPTVVVEPVEADETEVLPMPDSTNGGGEARA